MTGASSAPVSSTIAAAIASDILPTTLPLRYTIRMWPPPSLRSPTRAAWLGLALFGLALALRLAVVPTARFTADESSAWADAVQTARGEQLPLLGQPINGGEARVPGPAVPWVLALSQLPGASAMGLYAWMALLGSAAVLLVWHALRRPFGEPGALAAGLLLATSPWGVFHSVATNTVSLMPLPVALALLAAVRVAERPRPAWTAVLLGAAALLAQVHLSAPAVWVALLVVAGPSLRRLPRRGLVAGLGLVLLLQVPWVLSELQTGGANLRALATDDRPRTPTLETAAPALEATLRLLTLDTSHRELAGDWGGVPRDRRRAALWHGTDLRPVTGFARVTRMASLALVPALLVAMGLALWAALRRWRLRAPPPQGEPPHARFAAAALGGMATLIGLVVLAGRGVAAHHPAALQPFLAALVASLVARTPRAPRAARVLVWLGLCLVATGGVEATLAVSRGVDAPYGIAVQRQVAAWVVEHSEQLTSPLELAVDVDAEGPHEPWTIGYLAHLELGRTDLRFRAPGSTPPLVLRRSNAPAPVGCHPVLDAGAAILYRRGAPEAP